MMNVNPHLHLRFSPLLGNYFFNPNRNLKSGYCSLVVKSARMAYSGDWTCAGRLVGLDKESSDSIKVEVTSEYLHKSLISNV